MSEGQNSKIAISVVIPTYKGSKVIVGALDSLARQTINPNLIEVIVIDDCSPDNTLAVVKGYEKKLKHLRIYSTSQNTGNPVAGRNIGIQKARGEYIHFLDHDDRLGNEALERLYASAIEWNSDVIYGKYAKGDDLIGGQTIFSSGDIEKADPFIHREILEVLSPHKMFRRVFIKRHDLFFDPEVVIREDEYFVMKAFANAEVVSIKGDYDYYYRVRRDDGGNLTQAQVLKSPYIAYYAAYRIIKAIQNSKISERYKVQWMKLYAERFLRGYAREILDNKNEVYELDVVYDYVVGMVGDEVISRLGPEYRLLVKIVEIRNLPERQLFLRQLTATNDKTLQPLNNRLHFTPSNKEVYDASLLYKRLEYKIQSFDIKKGHLVIAAAVSVVLNRRESLRCSIKLTDLASDYTVYAKGQRIESGRYEFEVDIKNALSVAGGVNANYAIDLELYCGDVTMIRRIYRKDIEAYTESLVCPVNERYRFRSRSLGDGSVVGVLAQNKHYILRAIKNRASNALKH